MSLGTSKSDFHLSNNEINNTIPFPLPSCRVANCDDIVHGIVYN